MKTRIQLIHAENLLALSFHTKILFLYIAQTLPFHVVSQQMYHDSTCENLSRIINSMYTCQSTKVSREKSTPLTYFDDFSPSHLLRPNFRNTCWKFLFFRHNALEGFYFEKTFQCVGSYSKSFVSSFDGSFFQFCNGWFSGIV